MISRLHLQSLCGGAHRHAINPCSYLKFVPSERAYSEEKQSKKLLKARAAVREERRQSFLSTLETDMQRAQFMAGMHPTVIQAYKELEEEKQSKRPPFEIESLKEYRVKRDPRRRKKDDEEDPSFEELRQEHYQEPEAIEDDEDDRR